MQRLFHDQPIPNELRGAIVALGNFDGFHLGHQAVVGRAVQRGADVMRVVLV
jgi:riboflavin kinase/FMN adenylyltransferase